MSGQYDGEADATAAATKKLFFGGKKPAQRVVVRVGDENPQEEDSIPSYVFNSSTLGSRCSGDVDDARTPEARILVLGGGVIPSSTGAEDTCAMWNSWSSGKKQMRVESLPPEDGVVGPGRRGGEYRGRRSVSLEDTVHVPLISPVPIDSWKGFEEMDDEVTHGGMEDGARDALIQTWVNAVLDPWGTEKNAALESAVAIHSHKDVLKDRMRHQWMKLDDNVKEEMVYRPVSRVCQKIGKDPIKLAKRVEHVVQSATLHSRVINAFRSYSYVWLEVAHDIVCGKGAGCGTHVLSAGLSAKEEEWVFRILSIPLAGDRVTSRKRLMRCSIQYYCGKLSPHGYSRVAQHMLAIIVFLDRVFSSPSKWKIPLWAPPLFIGHGLQNIRASEHVIQDSLGVFLDQVDMPRYLKRFGCTVSYIQPRSRCTVFHVNNLAIDLRDGTKLCRLSEMLVGSTMNPVYPALKTSDRVENINRALCSMGLWAPGVAEDVADGNRSATIGVLWDCVVTFELEKSLNINSISLECDHILASTGKRSTNEVEVSEVTLFDVTSHPAAASVLKWVHCLCASYGEIILDDSLKNPHDRILVLEAFLAYYGDGCMSTDKAEYKNGSRAAGIFNKIDYILRGTGGIPKILTMEEYMYDLDIDHRPLLVFYALMCKRVLCVNYEHRSAIIIQRFWRKASQKKPGYAKKNLERWIDAAQIIQRNVKPFLCRRRIEQSASSRRLLREKIIQTQATWRGMMALRQYEAFKASSLVIQTQWRACLARKLYASLKQRHDSELAAAITIQSFWRQYCCSFSFSRSRKASIIIEKHWRSYRCQKTFLMMKNASIFIQSHARRLLVQKQHEIQSHAAVVIQSHFRAYRTRRKYLDTLKASRIIQQHWRRFHARREAQEKIQAIITIQRSYRKFRSVKVQKIRAMLEEQTENLSNAMKNYAKQFLDDYRGDRARRLALLEEQKKTSAAKIIQAAWKRFYIWRGISTYLLETYEKARKTVEMERLYGSAAVVIQRYYRRHVVSRNHPMSEGLADIRQRLTEATERAQILREEGAEDPTSLWNITQRALREFEGGNVLPSKATLQDLSICLGSSSTCCKVFIEKSGIDYTVKGMVQVSRDKYRHDSIIQACECIVNLSACGRFVDQVGQILVESGHMEALAMLIFQLRDDCEPFYSLVNLVDVLGNSRLFSEMVSSSKALSDKFIGVHRNLGIKHGQVASYLKKLEGKKGSDISAANATRMVFKMQNQISALEKLMHKLGICLVHEGSAPYKTQGKNTIVRQVLKEISTNIENR